MSVSRIRPCEESPCLRLAQIRPNPPLNLVFDVSNNNIVNAATQANPIPIVMPGTDVGRCGREIQVTGRLFYHSGGTTLLTANAGGGVVGGGNGQTFTNYTYEFDEPVDLRISPLSFEHNAGRTERFIILDDADEFIAGPGSVLATNPNGYPAGTVYADGNGGPSHFIFRQRTSVTVGIRSQSGFFCAAGASYLMYPEWIDPLCEENEDICPRQARRNLGLINNNPSQPEGIVTELGIEYYFVDMTSPAGTTHTVTLTRPLSNCNGENRVCIKRTSNNPDNQLRILSADGIDGATAGIIILGVSNHYGINSGESVCLIYDFEDPDPVASGNTAGTWRIL